MGNPQVVASARRNAEGGADIVVKSTNGVALWTMLTTKAYGRFSDNAFMVLPSEPVTVQFVPIGPFGILFLETPFLRKSRFLRRTYRKVFAPLFCNVAFL